MIAAQKGVDKAFKAVETQTTKAKEAMYNLNTQVQEGQGIFKGFRMEMLGVMFFGMAIQRMFSGMLRPAAEVFGIFELWGLTLQMVFLPIMELLFPIFLKVTEVLMDMPDSIKVIIGAFSLFMVALGTVLFLIGQFALGLGSLAQTAVFKSLVEVGVAALTSISGAFLAVLAVVLVVVAGIVLAFNENFLNIRAFMDGWMGGLLGMFEAFFSILKNLVKFWVALFKGDTKGAVTAVKALFKGLFSYFNNMIRALSNLFLVLGIGIIRIFTGVVRVVKGVFDELWTYVKGIIDKVINGIKKAIDKVNIFKKKDKSGSDGGSNIKTVRVNDFIMRPGQTPVKVNPNDTLVGFKSKNPMGGGTNITQNITVSGALKETLERMLKDNNQKLFTDIQRLSGQRG